MSRFALVNNVEHKNTKIITRRDEQYGDRMMSTMTFPIEFRNIQSSYPIFFQKDAETGQFFSIALLGFEKGENLFLTERGWEASYVPMSILRQPFMVGFQNNEPVLSIDMESPRVNEDVGEALFLDDGSNTDYLQEMGAMLNDLHHGYEHSKGFIEAIQQLDLIEPFTLEIKLNDGSDNQLLGFYTVNEEKLMRLKGEQLGELHERGYLHPLFMVVASMSRLTALIDKKNRSLK